MPHNLHIEFLEGLSSLSADLKETKTLEHSISCILQRHDVLRTNFVKKEEKIIQYVNDNHAFIISTALLKIYL
jgi:hypothetical protein